MERMPEVPLSAAEVRLVCDMMEAFVWTIHRWGRHEGYLVAARERKEEEAEELAAVECACDPMRAHRGG